MTTASVRSSASSVREFASTQVAHIRRSTTGQGSGSSACQQASRNKKRGRFLDGRDCREKGQALPKSTERLEGGAKKKERKKNKSNVIQAV